MPNTLTSIGEGAFSYCDDLTNITLPNSLTSIEAFVFNESSNLTNLTLPSSLTSIGEWAFSNCSSLTSLTLPSSLTFIDYYAFERCTGLTSVTTNWTTPIAINPTVFDTLTLSTIALNVPVGSAATYNAATVWKDFSPVNDVVVLGINEQQVALQTSVYPNPFTTKVMVHFNNTDATLVDIALYTNLGAKVLSTKTTTLDTKDLATGIYFLKVTTSKGSFTKKLVKK